MSDNTPQYKIQLVSLFGDSESAKESLYQLYHAPIPKFRKLEGVLRVVQRFQKQFETEIEYQNNLNEFLRLLGANIQPVRNLQQTQEYLQKLIRKQKQLFIQQPLSSLIHSHTHYDEPLDNPRLIIRSEGQIIKLDGEPIKLTNTEFNCFQKIAQARGEIVKYEDVDPSHKLLVQKHKSQIDLKLQPILKEKEITNNSIFETLPNIGYRLIPMLRDEVFFV